MTVVPLAERPGRNAVVIDGLDPSLAKLLVSGQVLHVAGQNQQDPDGSNKSSYHSPDDRPRV
jgi:hypothetical protein